MQEKNLNLFKASSLLTIINMFIPNHKEINTKVLDENKNISCEHNAASQQCGDPKITELECTKKGCCWMSAAIKSMRCYKRLHSIDVSSTSQINNNNSGEENFDSEKLINAIEELRPENKEFSSYITNTETFESSTSDFDLTLTPISFAELSTTFLNNIPTLPRLSNDDLNPDQTTILRRNISTPTPTISADFGNTPKKTTTLYSKEYSTLPATASPSVTTSSAAKATVSDYIYENFGFTLYCIIWKYKNIKY